MPADAAAEPSATSTAVTPSARALQSTPSSTSCQRAYNATLATPSAMRTTTTDAANRDRPQTTQGRSDEFTVRSDIYGRKHEREPTRIQVCQRAKLVP